ncbi:Mitochondrial intermediate peptidase [Bienertia sinuspersici]
MLDIISHGLINLLVREGPIVELIGLLVMIVWFLQFGENIVEYGDPLISDHSPLFNRTVAQAWQDVIEDDPMKRVWYKLKMVKKGLKQLHMILVALRDQEREKSRAERLRRILSIEESALKQKSTRI